MQVGGELIMINNTIDIIEELKLYCLDKYSYYSIKPDNITFHKFIVDKEECGTIFKFSHKGLAIELIINYAELSQLNTPITYFKEELMFTAEKLIYACRNMKE
jgi:hypothetical protein